MSRFTLLGIKLEEDKVSLSHLSGDSSPSGGSILPRRPSKSPKPTKSQPPMRQQSLPSRPTSHVPLGPSSSSSSNGAAGGDKSAVLRTKYTQDKLYRVVKDFPGLKEDPVPAGGGFPPNFADLMLKVKEGEVVGVVKRELPLGGDSHWFVDNGGKNRTIYPSSLSFYSDDKKYLFICSYERFRSSKNPSTECYKIGVSDGQCQAGCSTATPKA